MATTTSSLPEFSALPAHGLATFPNHIATASQTLTMKGDFTTRSWKVSTKDGPPQFSVKRHWRNLPLLRSLFDQEKRPCYWIKAPDESRLLNLFRIPAATARAESIGPPIGFNIYSGQDATKPTQDDDAHHTLRILFRESSFPLVAAIRNNAGAGEMAALQIYREMENSRLPDGGPRQPKITLYRRGRAVVVLRSGIGEREFEIEVARGFDLCVAVALAVCLCLMWTGDSLGGGGEDVGCIR
ncbi:hypothetical protein FKW77_002064 [Venturia effusa]|uniref:Tubby C-terminal domain-containing protein n=1 Tax=Venturia effusa TaxID=50376 RepID=A0A517LBY7_9PEZI|nr:hypothetical protein FKW77_002064 [Venturia effusa]